MTELLVYNIGELVVGPKVDGEVNGEEKGQASGSDGPASFPELTTLTNAALRIEAGTVAGWGPSKELTHEYPPESAPTAVDAGGRLVTPGFVDPHTHAVFAGDRSDEFVARIDGKTYTDIMDEGGGIPVTVEAVRSASEDELLGGLLDQLDVMLAHGTTTAEVKSGYGLDTDTELKMLRVIDRANEVHPIELIPTYMGAHAIPADSSTPDYVEAVIADQLPAIAHQGIARFCDVFCEEGVFDVEQSRQILEAGREYGLEPKLHAEEFVHIGGAQLAAELGATSADHLLQANADDAEAIAEAGVTPVFLPATAFALGEEYADPAPFQDAGAQIALGSDLNPSCYVHNMGFVLSLACLRMGLHPDTALLGATAVGARALDLPRSVGTLREGAPGDFVVFDHPDHVHLPYNPGSNRVSLVVADGEVVYEQGTWTYERLDSVSGEGTLPDRSVDSMAHRTEREQ